MSRKMAALLALLSMLAACGGGGGGSTPVATATGGAPTPSATPRATPTPTPTPTPNASPTVASTNRSTAFTCPTVVEPAAAARAGVRGDMAEATRRMVLKQRAAASSNDTTTLAITYGSRSATPALGKLTPQEAAAGGAYISQFAFAHTGKLVRVITVPTASLANAEGALRAQPGVTNVGVTGAKRSAMTVTPYFPSDPYFQGFSFAQNIQAVAGTTASPQPATYELPPYVETALVPGQWDMHAIQLEYAFGYSQPGNSIGPVPGALGSANVKLAIIDTGEDPTHPELIAKITRQRCFITSADGRTQSTGNLSVDEVGHGTNVSGIAAADTGSGLGFAGAGGSTRILAYRVFPTPDDNCSNAGSTDAQCETNTVDIASAIHDAVQQGASVISMSLGGGGCTGSGNDSDPTEGAAVEDAIAAGIIVVAASGNSGGAGVSAPACDSGVIAVGATGLDDGQPNGTGPFGGTSNTPVEYVTSYSQYGSPANQPGSPNAWGIVAPGGDPASGTDGDDLHWIENIWTSTPYMSSAGDKSFAGECTDDYPDSRASTAPVDCRVLIAGTSMATPHVAGAAALIIAATGGSGSRYASPTAMKTLLCQTADNLGSTQSQGCGRLNVYRAMAQALTDPVPPPPAP
jgi:subtilisin family serine protease